MNYLIDTNIISEVRKGRRCDRNVANWYEKIEDVSLYLSVLVIGEICNGIERVRPKDDAQANAIENWLITVDKAFGERILPVDRAVANEWGRLNASRPLPVRPHRTAAACFALISLIKYQITNRTQSIPASPLGLMGVNRHHRWSRSGLEIPSYMS